MKKYIGVVVRKSFQLPIAAEQDHFENKISCTKKTYLFLPTGTLKKSKTIFKILEMAALYFRRPLQKSGPTQGAHCITVYFPIVIENTSQNMITIGKCTVLHTWDHFWGWVDESKVLPFQGFSIFFIQSFA